MSGVASKDVRCEQAICFGRSEQWMLTHGYTRDDIRRAVARMDAAVAEDFDSFGELADPAEYGIAVDDTPFDRWTCGTHAAFVQHKALGEPVDVYCRNAERRYQRLRYERECDQQRRGAA